MTDAAILAAFERYLVGLGDGKNEIVVSRVPYRGPRTWLAEFAIDGIAYIAYWAHVVTPPRWRAI